MAANVNKDQIGLLKKTIGELGIDSSYIQKNINTMQKDVGEHALVTVFENVYAKPAQCTLEAKNAWELMHGAAQMEGIQLKIVSSYRSIEYQAELIKRKLACGQNLDEILKINAVPGWSEHHTGRALDLTSAEEDKVLEEKFEETMAFEWLTGNAGKYGFVMSYPKNNIQGYIYEPWHWCFHK